MRQFGQHTAYLHIVILLSFVFKISAQENNRLQNILGSLTNYNNNAPDKIYIQTDKDFYSIGDTIWLKTYLLNGITHTATTMSKVVYVELVDANDKTIAQQKLHVVSTGASSDIKLPQEIEEGTYILRAYTKYMLNDKEPILFQKEIPISSLQNNSNYVFDKNLKKEVAKNKTTKQEIALLNATKPIVQFFPEGGDLVTDIECVLGAKITDPLGNGIALEGKVLDHNDHIVSYFNSYEFGLGWTSIKVKPNTHYYLQIPFDGEVLKYPVPSALLKGYSLRVLNWGEHITITASTNITNGLKDALLIGHIRGDIIFKQILKANDENLNIIKLYTSKLQDGVAHFTLFAPNGEPVSERLTFIDSPQNDLKLSVKTNKQNYNLREKVNVDLTLTDDKGKVINGNFSMSVLKQNEIKKDTDNIKSWLLLNSDLGGTVSNPNFFFQEDLKGREYLLDLLMLTHGWRRFTWKALTNENASTNSPFPPEKGIMINGTTTAFNNKYQPKKALIALNIVANELIQEKKMTNAQGKFSFGPFIFVDSITAVINASSIPESEKSKDPIAIHLDPHFPEVTVKNSRKRELLTKKTMSPYTKPYPVGKVEQKITPHFEYDSKVTQLEEIVVKAKKTTKQELFNKKLNSRTIYGNPSTRLIPDSIPGLGSGPVNAFNVLRFAPGVQVFGTFPNQRVLIRPLFGNIGDAPLFLLDGAPASVGYIQNISITDILFIDVLKGADATIYGGRSAGGVVAVYTKRGEDIQQKPKELSGVSNVIIPGFYKLREFYKPNFEIPIPEHEKPDYRKTLHWEPDIKIKNNSPYKLDFYTGDASNTYVIRVEGITYDGRPVNQLGNFKVLNAD
jgi:hypothetical protein